MPVRAVSASTRNVHRMCGTRLPDHVFAVLESGCVTESQVKGCQAPQVVSYRHRAWSSAPDGLQVRAVITARIGSIERVTRIELAISWLETRRAAVSASPALGYGRPARPEMGTMRAGHAVTSRQSRRARPPRLVVPGPL